MSFSTGRYDCSQKNAFFFYEGWLVIVREDLGWLGKFRVRMVRALVKCLGGS